MVHLMFVAAFTDMNSTELVVWYHICSFQGEVHLFVLLDSADDLSHLQLPLNNVSRVRLSDLNKFWPHMSFVRCMSMRCLSHSFQLL